MHRATPRTILLLSSCFLLSGCFGIGLGGQKYLQELEAAQDPCHNRGFVALDAGLQPGAIATTTATPEDFTAGLDVLRRMASPSADLTAEGASFGPDAQMMSVTAQSLLGDSQFLSFESVRYVETVERGPITSLEQQAFAAGAGGGGPVNVSRKDWQASANDLWNATISDGWGSSVVAAMGQLSRARAARVAVNGADLTPTAEESNLLAKIKLRTILYLYFKSYFRNGKIISLSVPSDSMKQQLKDRLKNTIKDDALLKQVEDQIDQVADQVINSICTDPDGKCLALGVVGETTFVTRAGKSFGFPGIQASFDPFADKKVSMNKIDKNEVIGDLVRVLFEGIGDAALGVPAVKGSTACKYEFNCANEDQGKLLPKVDEIADRVEAGTTALTGVAIRGGWLVSLNNEALATAIQTGVGVAFRKGAEKAAWSIVSHECPAGQPPFTRVALQLSA